MESTKCIFIKLWLQTKSTFNTFIGTAVTQTNQGITVHDRFDRVDRQSAAIINRVNVTGDEVAELAHQAAEARIALHTAGSVGENLNSITAILNRTIADYADAQAQIMSLTTKLSDMEVRCDRLQVENSELQHKLEELTYEHHSQDRGYGDLER